MIYTKKCPICKKFFDCEKCPYCIRKRIKDKEKKENLKNEK